jgi:hypothetical protein
MGRAQDRLINRTEIIVVDHVWSPGYFGSAIDASGKSDYAAHGQEPLYCQWSGHHGLMIKECLNRQVKRIPYQRAKNQAVNFA